MVMEEALKSDVGQMKVIFDLCDQDRDGLICAQDFRKIGQQHFQKPHQVDALLHVMDPTDTGKISFVMFCRGIESFLLENHHVSTSSESSLSSLEANTNAVEECDGDRDCEDDDSTSIFTGSDSVYPMSSRHSGLCPSNGYISCSSAGLSSVELIVDPCEDDTTNRPLHSTPGSRSPSNASAVSRESPTLTGRHLLRRHQLTMLDGSSQGSTPAEGEAEVSRLSDQLHDLSSRLGELEDEQKDSEGYRLRLKKENTQLRARLEECEDLLKATEHANQIALGDSQERLRTSVIKVRRESENMLMDVQSQLQLATDKIAQLESSSLSLKAQLLLSQEEKLILEKEEAEEEERRKLVEEELHKTKDLLRMERNKWQLEKDSLNKVIGERDVLIAQLQQECEEIHLERQRRSITASDMDREIDRITKLLEQSHRHNEELQSRFLQEGQQLVIATSAPRSLAMEIESVSKDEVMTALRESEEMNARLNQYIDGLLTTIIEKHPEMLEKC